MTPEEVAASYDTEDGDGDGGQEGGEETAAEDEDDAPAGDGGRPGLADS